MDLRQQPTTIWVKKGTKDELDSYGARKDSYDDIIKKIVIENNQLKQRLEQLQSVIPEAKNRLAIREGGRKEMSLTLDKNSYLIFSFIPPPSIIDEDYRMGIHIAYIQKDNKKIKPKDYYKEDVTKLKHYLRAAEAIIKSQINPLFKIEEERLLDIQEWKRLFRNNGLSENSLKNDIRDEFIKSGLIV